MPAPDARGEDVGASEALRSLEAVLASTHFRACPRLASFLRFVVLTTLDGHADRIKGYTIGVEALGRGANFDPQSDPIVRVEAVRLRRMLARYYAGDGAGDPVVVELPRGRYVPRFRRHGRRREIAPALMQAIRAVQRVLQIRLRLRPVRRSVCLPHFGAAATTAPNPSRRTPDGRQDQQAESAPAARSRRPRAGRDRRDAAHDRGDPRGL